MIEKIELNIIDNCNSKCIMCPSKLMYKSGKSMSYDFIKKILNNIKECIKKEIIIKKPTIIIGFFGEPFLDCELFNKINLIKEDASNLGIVIYTNGLLLYKYKKQILENKKLIDKLIISNYGDTLEKFNLVTSLNIEKDVFKKMKETIELLRNKIKMRIWNAWRNGGLFDFSTRAGTVKKIKIKEETYGCKQNRLNYLNILSDGNLILCCQDWKKETIFGNIKDNRLINILKSDKYKDLIEKVEGRKESDLLFICKRCRYSKIEKENNYDNN